MLQSVDKGNAQQMDWKHRVFKPKYLTMPTITNTDALLIAAKDLQTALKGGVPQALQTTTAVRQLMKIFKANTEAARRKEQGSGSQRLQRERALRERLQMDHKHAEAAAVEEPPKLVSKGLDADSDSDNEDNDTAPEFEVVPTATPLACPWCHKTMMSRTHPRPTPERGTSCARCKAKPMSIWKQQWF